MSETTVEILPGIDHTGIFEKNIVLKICLNKTIQ